MSRAPSFFDTFNIYFDRAAAWEALDPSVAEAAPDAYHTL